jgi:hypothetical protein
MTDPDQGGQLEGSTKSGSGYTIPIGPVPIGGHRYCAKSSTKITEQFYSREYEHVENKMK